MQALASSDDKTPPSALLRYALLDTMAERAFNDLTCMAAYVAQTPIALLSLLDADRRWFGSCIGVASSESLRHLSFCAHAILEPSKSFVVADALADPRFSQNALVTAEPKIRFYCGAPLTTPNGEALGALSVIDRVPRHLDDGQIEALEVLAHQAMLLLEMRRFTLDQYNVTRLPRPCGAALA